MKQIILLLFAATLAACSRQEQGNAAAGERPPENGAQYKDREGVALTETMKKSIGLQVAEVAEEKVAPAFTVSLHVLPPAPGFQNVAMSTTSRTASGWLTEKQAAFAQPGTAVSLRLANGDTASGTVKLLEKAFSQVSGEFEVTVEAERPLEIGTPVKATFQAPAGEAVTSVPRSALLKTAEGNFVYAVNGERYVRTPVKVGAQNAERVEITDGLYSGDYVVIAAVTPLWLAELQVLRGGKACTCGH